MPTISYCSQADLERGLGGASVLAQLADPSRTGSPDTATVQDYLESGAAEIRTALEIKHEPETIANLDTDSLRRLRDANVSLSARISYEKGGLGLAMPEWVRERADRADKFLDQLATGTRRLGRVAGGIAAAINQPAGTVDFDSKATAAVGDQAAPLGSSNQNSGISIAAFRLGFR